MIKNSTIEIAKGVSRKAVIKCMNNNKKINNDIHSFKIIHNGEEKVRIAPAPYSFDYKQQIFSLSKSFTSTAIGLLSDDGVLDIDDKIIDIFPDKCPKKIGKNLEQMTIRHILSMNTGHKECVLMDIKDTPDPVAAFLSIEPDYEPGTYFAYNNAATYMLSEIVSKYTNMTLYDFLSYRLFEPLGIENVHWHTFNDGKSQGATGLHASCDDIAKFGMLYLNKGIYNGKRILSESWVNNVSKPWSDNSSNGTPDWTAGYGFQFWLNSKDGYRADGALGQICLILPSKNMIIAVEAVASDMQKEIDFFIELADNLYDGDNISDNELETFINSYNKPCEYTNEGIVIFDSLYMCSENMSDITLARFTDEPDRIDLHFSNGKKWQTMSFGKGKFCDNKINVKCFKPTIDICKHNHKEDTHFVSYAQTQDGKLILHANFLDAPYTANYVCCIAEDTFSIRSSYDWELSGNKLQ